MLGETAPDESAAPQVPPVLEDAVEQAAGAPPPADTRSWWQRTREGFAAVGKPLLLGAVTFACLFGLLTYGLVNAVWHLRVRLKRRARQRNSGAAGARP
jgi:hypothetical protein